MEKPEIRQSPIETENTAVPKAIPDKLFYKIGEVSRIAGLEPYVLRYWETEFSFLKPRKNRSGQRVYIKKDIYSILQVKNLLYNERYTIEGVKKKFAEEVRKKDVIYDKPQPAENHALIKTVARIRQKLNDILKQLN